ncbi:MAG: response regulator [Desulfobacteraceae bacterium]|nr:response regulator [Desulfobacteraceae bacterium]
MVVDDDSGIRDLTVNALTYCVDRKVLSFENGQFAWQYLQDGGDADIVICDVDMPVMSGFELMTKVKQKNPEKIFIIMSGEDANEKKAELAGANAFLGKPFSINDLFNLVQYYIVD